MMQRRSFIASSIALAAASALPERTRGAGLAPFPLFDTHAHFYTNQPDKYPFNARGARYGAERMIEKAMNNPMTPEAVFRLWDRVGIEMGTGVQYNSTYATDNSYLLDVAKQHPDRIIPVVILPPTDPATAPTLQKFAKENRIAGVRFTGSQNQDGQFVYLSDAAKDAWAVCNELGLAIVLMPLGNQIPAAVKQIAVFAGRYPNVDIVIDHVGFPQPYNLPQTQGLTPEHLELAAHKNVYYKFTNFLIAETNDNARRAGKPEVELKPWVEYMVNVYGADHFVWGTDVGNVEVDQVEYVQKCLDATAGLTEKQRRDFFYNTAKRIFVPGGHGRRRA
ncbi:MAG: amidohydrolase family protein [Pseudomonadota bacterium]|jgi:L-fuconolactonase